MFKPIDGADLVFFKQVLGEPFVSVDSDSIKENSLDRTSETRYRAEVVLFPRSAMEISQLLSHCNEKRIAITVRGAGTGLAGGAIPVHGGVVLSMKRFDKILEIDERNLQCVVEPGVVTEHLQNTLQAKNLFYPPDPASRGSSFIGGNVSTGAGGPRAVKYGVVKDYVIDLEVVMADGSIIRTGARTLKNSTGYNLTQLFVGSEGTLGVVTRIYLKLIPFPVFNLLMLAPFRSLGDACAAVSAVFRAGIVPSALEFMEKEAVNRAIDYFGHSPFPVDGSMEAQLIIEVDGPQMEPLYVDCEKIAEVLSQFNVGEILFADGESQKTDLWRLRRSVGPAVKKGGEFLELDTVVPRAELPELMSFIKKTGEKHGFQTVSFGHAGDGNVHVNVLKEDISQEDWLEKVPLGIGEIFEKVRDLGGTISGEHGIGLMQKRWLPIVFSEREIGLRRAIKTVFDPNGILNPGKIF